MALLDDQPRSARLLVSALVMFFAGWSFVEAYASETLACTREADAVRCSYEQRFYVRSTISRELDLAGVEDADFREFTGRKSKKKGSTRLVDASGHELEVFTDDRREAKVYFERVEAFLADPGAEAVEIERETPVWKPVAFVGFALLGLLVFVRALREPSAPEATAPKA